MNLRWVRGISITAIGEGGAAILARLPLSWRGLGALVLGVLLAQWCWILLAPQAMTIATVTERSAAVETGHLFGQSRSEVTSVDGMALSNVRLVGVFAASVGKPGFAVLKLDDKHQVGVAVGWDSGTWHKITGGSP